MANKVKKTLEIVNFMQSVHGNSRIGKTCFEIKFQHYKDVTIRKRERYSMVRKQFSFKTN